MATYTITNDDLKSLQGKTILIFGAATGIGRAAVEIALKNGSNVAIGDWNEEASSLIKGFEDRALFKRCDVSNWDNVLDTFQETYAKFGIIHSVLSNAGINIHEDLLSYSFDKQTGRLLPPSLKSIDVNLIGQIYVSKCALFYFEKWSQTRCQLVMTSSAGTFFPAPPIYMYCAAKSGVVGLMRGLRSEVVKKNVTVNTVAPWMTVTPMTLPEWLDTWGSLPTNSAEAVARSLFLPVVQQELNGKSSFIADNKIFEFEDALYDAEPTWMGAELCNNVRKGQKLPLEVGFD